MTALLSNHRANHANHHPALHATPAAWLIVVAQFAFFAALASLILFFRHTPEFVTLSITFVSIFLQALPFMLLGTRIGGFIEVFVSKTLIMRIVQPKSCRPSSCQPASA